MLRFPSLLSGLVVASLLLACGDDGGSGGGGQGGDGTGGSGASGGNGAGGLDPADYAGFGYVGAYSYASTVGGMPFVVSGAYAGYSLALEPGQQPSCTTEAIGDCSVVDCQVVNGMGVEPTKISAGKVTITGGLRTVELLPDAGGNYTTDQSTMMGLFDGGETLTFAVDGAADVPAHQATLTAPGAVEVTEPDLASPPTIDRAADLALSWSGGTSGDVQASIAVSVSDGVEVTRSVNLLCRFAASSGTATIPADALALLPASDATTNASMALTVVARTQVEAGDYLVSFDASAAASTSAGLQASSPITLE